MNILENKQDVNDEKFLDILFSDDIGKADPELFHILDVEDERQFRKLIMIASESQCPLPVRLAMASNFVNIYAEGYPTRRLFRETGRNLPDVAEQLSYIRRYSDRRYYKGVEYTDFVEALAARRAAALFATDTVRAEDIFVNVQPLSGAAANNAVYEAVVEPGDTVMGMDLMHGGHLTHGSHANRSGKNYHVVSYHADYETGDIDYREAEELAFRHRPKLIIAGYSAYPKTIDWQRFRDIADSVGATLLADISHPAGLVAGRAFPSPVGYADIISFTTHKTLCGPRGAAILTTDEEYARKIDSAVFPGEQGGPHMHTIAAKAVLFRLADTDAFREMQRQVLANSRAMAKTIEEMGGKLAYGGTDSHMFLIDIRGMKGPHGFNLRGEVASRILDMCGITCNKNTIPGDVSAVHPGALRFGTTWLTQRGFGEKDVQELARIIYETLEAMIPYKYLEISGDVGRAKIALKVMEETSAKVQDLIRRINGDYKTPKSAYPHNFHYLTDRTVKASPIEQLHKDSGAHMETIDGYMAPLYYESPDEYRPEGLYLIDNAPSGTFTVRGERSSYFLDEVTTSRISALKAGEAAETFLMENSGAVLEKIFVGKLKEDHYIVKAGGKNRDRILMLLRGLGDGYILFDDRDVYAKIQGPVTVEDMANHYEETLLLTSFYIGGAEACRSLADSGIEIRPDTLIQAEIKGVKTLIMTVGCSHCHIMTHPKNAADLWRYLAANIQGIKPAGISTENRLNTLEMKNRELGDNLLESRYAMLVDMTKPYFLGQQYLAARLGSVPEKKHFSWQEPESAETQKTVLYEEHKKLGGRMAPFAGFEMPVWYSSINEEHRAVRTAAGLFDVSHMGILGIEGRDASRFIDTIASNYVPKLLSGQSQYSYLMDSKGNILDDIMVYCFNRQKYMIVVNAANTKKIQAWLDALLTNDYCIDEDCPVKGIRYDVSVKDWKDPACGSECRVDIALQGPLSQKMIGDLLTENERKRLRRINRNEFIESAMLGVPVMISRTGYTGEDMGYELYIHPDSAVALWKALLEKGAAACGLGARDSTRTEAGLPLYGHELAGPYDIDPIEAGYAPFVKFHKPFFIGRKVMIEKEAARKMEIIRFKMTGKGIRVVKTGDPLITKRGDTIGHVTSAVIVDGIQYGLAYVNKKYTAPGSRLSLFILPRGGKTQEKQKCDLCPGDKVMLPEEAQILSRFPEKDEFERTYRSPQQP